MTELINKLEDNFADDELRIGMAYDDQVELFDSDEKYGDSWDWYQKTLAGYRRAGSPSGKLIGNICKILKQNCGFEGSLKYFSLSLSKKWKLEPPNEVSIMLMMRNIADSGETIHDYKMELHWYGKALALSRNKFGDEHDRTIRNQYLTAGT